MQMDAPGTDKADSTVIAQSALLLMAIGHQQSEYGYPGVDDIRAVADLEGVNLHELPALIERGLLAGYLEEDEVGWLGLSPRGWDWWERNKHRRSGIW